MRIFSCPYDMKNHASAIFFTCFMQVKNGKIKKINILCVGYNKILPNGRIQSLKKMRFDEKTSKKGDKNEHKKSINRRFKP